MVLESWIKEPLFVSETIYIQNDDQKPRPDTKLENNHVIAKDEIIAKD